MSIETPSSNVLDFTIRNLSLEKQRELRQSLLDELGVAAAAEAAAAGASSSFAQGSFQLVAKMFIEMRYTQQDQQKQNQHQERQISTIFPTVPASVVTLWSTHCAEILLNDPAANSFLMQCIFAPDLCFDAAAVASVEKLDCRRIVRFIVEAVSAPSSSPCAFHFFGTDPAALKLFACEVLFGRSGELLYSALCSLWIDVANKLKASRNANPSEASNLPLFELRRRTSSNPSVATAGPVFLDGTAARVLLAASLSFRFLLEVSSHFSSASEASGGFLLSRPSSATKASPRQIAAEKLTGLIESKFREKAIDADAKNCLLLLLLLSSDSVKENWQAQTALQLQLAVTRPTPQAAISISPITLCQSFVYASVPFGGEEEDEKQLSPTLRYALSSPVALSLFLNRAFDLQPLGDVAPLAVAAQQWLLRVLYENEVVMGVAEEEQEEREEGGHGGGGGEHETKGRLRSLIEETALAASSTVSALHGARQKLSDPEAAIMRWSEFTASMVTREEQLQQQQQRQGKPVVTSFLRAFAAFEHLLVIWTLFGGVLLSPPHRSGQNDDDDDGDDVDDQSSLLLLQLISSTGLPSQRFLSPVGKSSIRALLEMISESGNWMEIVTSEAAINWLNTTFN